jgi:hypothetical protein
MDGCTPERVFYIQLNVLVQRAGREQIDRLEVPESAVFKVSAFYAAEETSAISFAVANFVS